MKKHLLIGNGFDIQFGGRAFTSQFIIQRIKYRAQMGIYDSLFEKTISGQEIVAIIERFVTETNSLMSGKYEDSVTADEVVEEISKYPQFERERLCKLAKDDMQERNPGNIPTDERGLLLQTASISNIALSEGISPSALYVLCVMNYDEYFK